MALVNKDLKVSDTNIVVNNGGVSTMEPRSKFYKHFLTSTEFCETSFCF
jgi:hypothetical protein